ncbi:ABC transporter substrate-binding protein [Salinibius halmophilus]|uniref:ABC transporter substrate-binding protein n=1 Tax=Salinibius halmophilus TaxID=1853216 RepID=UPI000E66875C|nr:ABC transporter substrate-binding protein [Salinibius halmophilus]
MKSIIALFLTLVTAISLAQTRTVASYQGEIEIPANPQRIVALLDHMIMLPLYELDANVVGSVGRQWEGQEPYIRGVRALYQQNFADLGVEFVGTAFSADIEKITALNPDLIITYNFGSESLEQLEAIAPTYVIDADKYSYMERFELLAEVTNTTDVFNAKKAHYDERVAEIQAWLTNPADISVAMAMPRPDSAEITLYRDYGAFSQVANDIGFSLPAFFAEQIGESASAKISIEDLASIDADYLFDTFEPNRGDTATSTIERYNSMIPNWCEAVEACREGRYIPLRRTDSFSMSFKALDYVLAQFATHIAARHELYFNE